MVVIVVVDDGEIGYLVGQDCDLFQCRCQGVVIIGVVGKVVGVDDEIFVDGCGEVDFGVEFVVDLCFVFGDVIDFGFVQGVNFVFVFWGLCEQVINQLECF